MKIKSAMMMASMLALFSMAANAVTVDAAKKMSGGDNISLTGTVENFDSKHSFMLRDDTGAIKVELGSMKSVVLKNGETVSVTGVMDKGILSANLVADEVKKDKPMGTQASEAIDQITGENMASKAQAADIGSLPDKGLVKLNGRVTSVYSEKKFTLMDSTGKINVNIKSDLSASLQKGTEVAVIGYVEKGMLVKTIDATKIDIVK